MTAVNGQMVGSTAIKKKLEPRATYQSQGVKAAAARASTNSPEHMTKSTQPTNYNSSGKGAAVQSSHGTYNGSQPTHGVRTCSCPCQCQQQTSQTSHMMSILSNSHAQKNNTMTLIKGGRGGLSSLGPNTTLYGEESLVENGEIEELHYLMVRVEKMKKTMLGKVEGRARSAMEMADGPHKLQAHNKQQNTSPTQLDDDEAKEEMLYRVYDQLIDHIHTAGAYSMKQPDSEYGTKELNAEAHASRASNIKIMNSDSKQPKVSNVIVIDD